MRDWSLVRIARDLRSFPLRRLVGRPDLVDNLLIHPAAHPERNFAGRHTRRRIWQAGRLAVASKVPDLTCAKQSEWRRLRGFPLRRLQNALSDGHCLGNALNHFSRLSTPILTI